MTILWSTDDWARAIAAMPTVGPLPARVVLVPNGRVAHALRARILASEDTRALIGTRFVTPAVLAAEVLVAAGVRRREGEATRRPARVRACLDRGVALEHFELEALRTRPGWDAAFASTIGDLEDAGLTPDTTPVAANAQVADVVRLWRSVDADAKDARTTGRLLADAAAALHEGRGREAIEGPVLAVVTGHASGADAAFIRALPDVTLHLLGLRPVRRAYLQRIAALFGGDAAAAVEHARAPAAHATERDLLATFFLAAPETLADPTRPISRGPDGTVTIEEHAGTDEELEATRDWVLAEVATHGTPLEELAVLVPAADPFVGLLAERLAPVPVFVAGGIPIQQTAAGARFLAVVDALRAFLPVAAVARVLPVLRGTLAEHSRLTHGRALELAYALGTLGGGAADPRAALGWRAPLAARGVHLRARIVATQGTEGETSASQLHDHEDYVRKLADLEHIGAALEALVDVMDHVITERPLSRLGPALVAYVTRWVNLPPPYGAPLLAQLGAAVEELCADDGADGVTGIAALDALADELATLRVAVGSVGAPAVYVGTLRGALGLPFRAVRVLGLAEGTIPAAPREDPVLPDVLRATLGPVTTSAERALAGTHALAWVVHAARERVVLSAPRAGLDGSVREPSSILLEAAAALRRPNAATGAAGPAVPDLHALHRDAFSPARTVARALRTSTPRTWAAWLDRVAAAGGPLPASWSATPAVALDRLQALIDPTRPSDALDGLLDAKAVLGAKSIPGVGPARAISASRLKTLLTCPHQFLYGTLLGWDDPPGAPDQSELDVLTFGKLVHAIIEEFGARYGEAFGRREDTLPAWQAKGRKLADELLDALLAEVALLGSGVRARERDRVRRQAADFLAYDWEGPPRRFVATERAFGFDVPLPLRVGKRTLHVRGSIDRLDVEGKTTIVRDLKTGRAHPRRGNEADPTPDQDLQLGLYGLVVAAQAKAWGVPARVAVAYVYPGGGGATERAFRDDHAVLDAAATEWLTLAADLLEARAFPRTIDPDDCTYCSFDAACGPDAHARAADVLGPAKGVLARFRALKESP